MTTAGETWAALLDLLNALAGLYRDDFRRAVSEAGLAREPVGVLLHAGDIDPQLLTAADLLRCVPYYAEVSFTAPMTRLAQLLSKLLAACRASPVVADQACLAASGNIVTFVEPTAMATTARVLEALTNFRCDAHRTAWRPTGVDGPTWETLTWLWDGRADSAASLFKWSQKQPHPRAFGAADYAACLAKLAARGWAEPAADGRHRLTEAGRQFRQGIEDQTNAFFYGPWPALMPSEIDELHARARAVLDGLKA